jgi:hypothetical protein
LGVILCCLLWRVRSSGESTHMSHPYT